jgi:acyl-CoA thioesterase YciA
MPAKRKRGCSLIRVEMHPIHANANIVNGKMHVFGGEITKYMDTAAASAARSICRNKVVTVSFPNVTFKKPVFVGDTLECHGEVIEIGRTSIRVKISVDVVRQDDVIHVTDGEAVFVSVDDELKPIPVIGWDFKRPKVRKRKTCGSVTGSDSTPKTDGSTKN